MNRLTWKPPRNRNYDAWERWQRSKLDEATTAPANVPAGGTRAPVFNPERDLPPAPDLTPPPGSRSAENIALAEKARAEWDEIRKANNTEPEWADVYALGYASWQSFAEAELGGFAIDTARGWQGRAASICRALASGPPEAGGAGGGASAKSKAALSHPDRRHAHADAVRTSTEDRNRRCCLTLTAGPTPRDSTASGHRPVRPLTDDESHKLRPPSTVQERVLITGVSGLIGSILRRSLADDYDLSGIDVRRVRGFESSVGNMTKLRSIRRAFEGVDLVVDLAADANPLASWKRICTNNLPATLNALEAARNAGVRRLVFASSSRVTGMYEKDEPYAAITAGRYDGLDPGKIPYLTMDSPVRPDGPYAAGKVFGEAACRYYADECGLSVICLRIGTVNQSSRPRHARDFATLLTHQDLVRLVRCSLQASDNLRFAIFYGVSRNTWRFWDIEDARARIGYRPLDDAEVWRSDAVRPALQ